MIRLIWAWTLRQAYAPALDACLRRAVRVLSLALTVRALVLGLRLGTDFMPELDEGAHGTLSCTLTTART